MHKRLRRGLAAVAIGVSAAVALVGCASGSSSASGGSASDVSAALKKGGTITYWSWTPSAKAQVAAFEKAYPKVHVKLVNAGTGTDEYTKLQNTIKAGSGAPDVAQVEYFAVPQFALSNSLADLTSYGFGSLKGKYSASTWDSVAMNGKIYGLPQDSGPMALFYNKRIFDQYGLAVPKTWSEYVADAKKLHAANPSEYITADNGDPGFATSMIWQAGGTPFTTNGTKVSIDLQDAGSKKWTSTWNPLVQGKLLSTTPAWSDDWFKQLGNGQIASLITGAWMPGNLEASAPAGSGDWRVAPMPTYDGSKAVTANNGGSSQVVMKQSKNPALAAGFLKWLNSSSASTKIFAKSGGFPSTTADLESSSFLNDNPSYFGGQKINEVLVDASKNVKSGFTYLPYEVYANSVFADTVGQSYQNNTSLDSGLQSWQSQLVKYGKQQGFTVSSK
ncbi:MULTISPECIES: sugar ABC transporter substrate-binding protein [unclassified Curtobacterium]|uniref:ABC transporter substrate-binding protein n=1 Tax=unclassified Curtobacterium TaxID=257496 RepID=UPI000DA87AC7|nr:MULTISPECIES: sugar ABC transporter substrate-binding protein [unclassified Curtobacterium]PZE23724.1 sugar ABC transporter substrate-binding protein [Curtobacterium sp. MCBD17_028]PZF60017.1 sugar ABC transporter substrate-binding protein [Curtobacterium sp. MCBD17_013]PZF62180.1 sugar ABC transporter substrate-binding protein [Curtobacterium sp. MCBD17_034]PZM32993.1 sugar ABC transporter substrate-binding protein [Curtobacterium sp. MCBD17_031]WIB63789.1 sugar ABC transporter substrate-b